MSNSYSYLEWGRDPKKRKTRKGMAGLLAFWVAWRLRIVLLLLAAAVWFFFVPAGILGKPGPSAQPTTSGQTPIGIAVQTPVPSSGGAPAATAVPPAVAAAPTPNAAGQCMFFEDYQLKDQPEVATSGTAIRVQWWVPSVSNEEFDTFLMAHEAKGGRFIVKHNPPLEGHVFGFKGACTAEYMKDHIEREIVPLRLAGGANNKGYREWKSTGLFQPAVAP